MSTKKTHCTNCEYQLTPYHNFCPNCGQKVDDKLSMRVLFHNTIMNYFSVDARFFRSFIPLFTKPGFLAKQFVGGKRLLYLHPAQFYLFASIVFFFIFSIATRSAQREFDNTMKETFVTEKSNIVTQANHIKDSISKELASQKETMNTEDSLALVKAKNLLDDNVVNDSTKTKKKRKASVSGKIFGLDFDTRILDSLENSNATMDEKLKAIGHKETDPWFTKFIRKQVLKFRANRGVGLLKAFFDTLVLSTFFYLIISLKRFYEQGYVKTFFKTCILSFVYLIFVVPVTFVLLWIISFVLY